MNHNQCIVIFNVLLLLESEASVGVFYFVSAEELHYIFCTRLNKVRSLHQTFEKQLNIKLAAVLFFWVSSKCNAAKD